MSKTLTDHLIEIAAGIAARIRLGGTIVLINPDKSVDYKETALLIAQVAAARARLFPIPKGPVGFKVLGVTWLEGDPILDCIVAGGGENAKRVFQRINFKWYYDGIILTDEENDMVERCWQGEMERLAIPQDKR